MRTRMPESTRGDSVYFRWRKPVLCPTCESRRIATIVWGMPSSDIMPDLEAGKVVCGGCCVSPVDPKWQCLACGTRIYPARKREEYLRMKG